MLKGCPFRRSSSIMVLLTFTIIIYPVVLIEEYVMRKKQKYSKARRLNHVPGLCALFTKSKRMNESNSK
jgi:hypothetical protein